MIIGAGMSGLCAAIQLKRAGFASFLLVEKSHDVGGTWFENTYPNAGCDIPSYLYSFSFAPKLDWSQKYARQPEILDYFRECADRFDIRSHIRFGTSVSRAEYDESARRWAVHLDDGSILSPRFVISAVGQLNRPSIPPFEGLSSFAGEAFHSAQWNHELDLSGKSVAVVGNGASAIQFLKPIAEQAGQVHLFQRSPNWIHPLDNQPYSDRRKRWFRRFPALARLHRLRIFLACEIRIFAFDKTSIAGPIYKLWLRRQMRKRCPRELAERVIPNYPPGCKRILLSNDYLETLDRENVNLVVDPIEKVVPEGVATNQGVVPADVMIFATGFQSTRFLYPMQFVGRNGIDLHDAWTPRPRTFLGIASPGFPNLFLLYGPNTNLGHNSIIFMVERQVNYVVRAIETAIRAGKTELEVREESVAKYDRMLQRALGKTVWVDDCTNWYKLKDGSIVNNWCGGALAYWWRTRQPKMSDFR